MSRDEPWEQVAFFDGALAYDMLPQRLKDAANNPEPHNTEAVPVYKMDTYPTPQSYRWKCSCGREGKGTHRTEVQALKVSKDHVK